MAQTPCRFVVASLLAGVVAGAMSRPVLASYLTVYGSPTEPGSSVASPIISRTGTHGLAAGHGHPGVARWGPDESSSLLPLPHIGPPQDVLARGMNASGAVIGVSTRFDLDTGIYLGYRAVRWDPGTVVPVELGNIGTNANGFIQSIQANAINDGGTIVGSGVKYNEMGVSLGTRAIRWDTEGVAATELSPLTMDANGLTNVGAGWVNNAGVVLGNGLKHDAAGNQVRFAQAVVWDPDSTMPRELSPPAGLEASSEVRATGLNNAGEAIGYVRHGPVEAVRWNTATGESVVLANPWGQAGSYTEPRAINDLGMVVGDGSHPMQGHVAIRWNADGVPTMLGNLGLDMSGIEYTEAFGVNDAGIAVGIAQLFIDDSPAFNPRAVYWGADGVAVDLNTLIDPDSGWELLSAKAINNGNWIAGIGSYDPDGPGGQPAYERAYLLQLPEPTILLSLAAALTTLRRSRSA